MGGGTISLPAVKSGLRLSVGEQPLTPSLSFTSALLCLHSSSFCWEIFLMGYFPKSENCCVSPCSPKILSLYLNSGPKKAFSFSFVFFLSPCSLRLPSFIWAFQTADEKYEVRPWDAPSNEGALSMSAQDFSCTSAVLLRCARAHTHTRARAHSFCFREYFPLFCSHWVASITCSKAMAILPLSLYGGFWIWMTTVQDIIFFGGSSESVLAVC